MVESRRHFSTFVALGVVLMAMLGYVAGVVAKSRAGHGHVAVAPAAQQRPAFAATVLFESSSGWKPAAAGPQIPGLPVTNLFTLGPGGHAARAGLLTGQVPAARPSLLPAAFVARLRGLPHTSVVNLSQTEAFRYSGVRVAGFSRRLTLYAIPTSGGPATVLACYASASFTAEMRTCEQIVTTLRPLGQAGSGGLAPDLTFAAQVSALVGALDRRRLAMRREMRLATRAALGRLAGSLAEQFAVAGDALARTEPPPAVGQAQAALARALRGGHDAYGALSAAAAAGSAAPYEAARARVYEAEAEVGTALESFALLGYSHR